MLDLILGAFGDELEKISSVASFIGNQAPTGTLLKRPRNMQIIARKQRRRGVIPGGVVAPQRSF